MSVYVGGRYQVYYKNKNYSVSQLMNRVSWDRFLYILWDSEFHRIYKDLEKVTGELNGDESIAKTPEELEYLKEYLISKWG